MGCNCKKKVDTINEKLGNGEKTPKKINIFKIIGSFFMRLVLAVLCCSLVGILFFPFLIYVFFCIVIAREPKVNVGKLGKYMNTEA